MLLCLCYAYRIPHDALHEIKYWLIIAIHLQVQCTLYRIQVDLYLFIICQLPVAGRQKCFEK